MTQEPALPQELFDYIIDFLFDDLESLCACALVSSHFLPSSRIHVFSHLRLAIEPERPISELHNILVRFPHLASRVQSIHIWDHIMRRHSWIEEYPTSLAPGVAQFSRMLGSLERLAITIEAGFVHWANVSKALRQSIYLTLAVKTLTCLEVTGIYGLPFKILAYCRALRSVTLKWVTFDERDNLDFAAQLAACADSPPTQLTHLSIDLDTRVLELLSRWILLPESPLTIAGLTSFACTADGLSDNITIQRLLGECAGSLQHLRLKNISGALNLSELERLRTLRVETLSPLEPRLLWLASFITFPPHPVGLVISVVSESASPQVLQLTEIDEALAQIPSIASVALILLPQGINTSREREQDLVDVSATFASRMPLAASKGAFQVLRSLRFKAADV
ncbi:hypothetical protein C8F04DRAFT_1060444 [Mycena alexandri]|uniref:Uncharacterized protein n=1 Tax=Mycena alexandri TaxID=1745969 RepID=A0AAD6TQ20_9AGAR|nr:hypothetical protein C8F04DRAFT_1060444 [Mycena alexandri]